MIESIEFENLRGVRTGKVDALAAINVVVGPNNSGKTTLLEAFAILRGIDSFPGACAWQDIQRREEARDSDGATRCNCGECERLSEIVPADDS